MYSKQIAFIVVVFVLSACSSSGGANSSSSLGSVSSPAPISPASESNPSATIPPEPVSTRSIGTPVAGWDGIPIMPGAYGPELEDMVYLYSVDSSVEEVEGFYQAKMDVNGWDMINRQVMEASASSGASTILDYQKNDQSLNVMLVALPEGNSTTVILSRLSP